MQTAFGNKTRMDAGAGAATSLRAELKQWEKTFTLQNSRKPGREDIKNNPAIGRSPLSIYLPSREAMLLTAYQLRSTRNTHVYDQTARRRQARRTGRRKRKRK